MAIYPEMSDSEMRRWVDGEKPYAPLLFVLDDKGEVVGGAVWEVQEHLSPTQVVLQLDAIFVKRARRRQGLGRRLLKQSLAEARAHYHYSGYGLTVVGFLVQTTNLDEGAADFYRAALDDLNLPYEVVNQTMGEVIVTVFLVTC